MMVRVNVEVRLTYRGASTLSKFGHFVCRTPPIDRDLTDHPLTAALTLVMSVPGSPDASDAVTPLHPGARPAR